MKRKNLFRAAVIWMAVTLTTGCKKKDDDTNTGPPAVQNDAVYIINEGAFGSGNGSIDYYSAKEDSIFNDAYTYVNGIPLGDVVQSMTVFNGKGYICVNNSQKMEVINMTDMVNFGTSNGFQGPRFFLGISNTKGYVSDWFANKVKVVDLTTLAITDSIPTGNGPEQMALADGKVFVANVGGYGNDSTITVIDPDNNSVISTLQTGLNPNSLRIDANGRLWVLCGGTVGPDFTGGTADDRAGSLMRINPSSLAIEKTFTMNPNDHPVKLTTNWNKLILYFLNGSDGYKGKVFAMNINDSSLPSASFINQDFYGLGVSPVTGDIYGGYSPDFVQSGTMFRYKSSGSLLSTKTTGIGPNGFVFY